MGLMDSMHMKNVYIRQKHVDQEILNTTRLGLSAAKRNNQNMQNCLNYQYKVQCQLITEHYSSILSSLRAGLKDEKDENVRAGINAQISQYELEMKKKLADLENIKEETNMMAIAAQTPIETYWEQTKTNAEQAVQMDDGFIKYYTERIKEALGVLFPHKASGDANSV